MILPCGLKFSQDCTFNIADFMIFTVSISQMRGHYNYIIYIRTILYISVLILDLAEWQVGNCISIIVRDVCVCVCICVCLCVCVCSTSQTPQGLPGSQGAKGTKGAQGSQGVKHITGDQGPLGVKGDPGLQGLQGLTGPAGLKYVGGSTDIRWGLSTCSSILDTSLVYEGIAAAGTCYERKGEEQICFACHSTQLMHLGHGNLDYSILG